MSKRRVVTRLPYGKNGESISLVQTGGMLFTSSVPGVNLSSGALGSSPEEQFRLAFENLQALLEAGHCGPGDVGLLTVYIPDSRYRPLINRPWLDMFPDDEQRPARKTTQHSLPNGQIVQLQAVGVAGAERQAVDVPGLQHRDPLPVGARIGDLLFSSVIGGQDRATGEPPSRVEDQIEQAFSNLRTLVERGGGTAEDIALVWVFLRDREDQPAMVRTWLRMFPRDGDRPARKTIFYEELRGRTTAVQLQAVAVIGQGQRRNFEVPGIGHHDPIPMGAQVGSLLFSSGIGGYDPQSGQLATTFQEQVSLAMGNMRRLMEQAEGSLDSVGQVTVMLRDHSYTSAFLELWRKTFADVEDQPAYHIMTIGLPGQNLVQLHLTAVI